MSVIKAHDNDLDGHSSAITFAIVRIKFSEGPSLKETVEIISVSATGAGFYMNHQCKPGTLVSMLIPMEPELRCYDHDRELYPVWGIIQHCHPVAGDDGKYHIGVGFIGKKAPDSYNKDPEQSYRICGMNEFGLWKINEAAREFKPRRDPRFYIVVDHYLAIVDSQQTSVLGEKAKTENVSRHGAAVVTSLDLHVGDRVKFISEELDFSGLAVVCNRREGRLGKNTVNLQFVDMPFPVEKVQNRFSTPTSPVNEKIFV